MKKIKCFALYQPYATLVVHGLKLYETRPLYSSHRGLTGILATKRSPDWSKNLFYEFPFLPLLKQLGYDAFEDLPHSGVIGTVEVKDWRKIVLDNPKHPQVETTIREFSTRERAFGDYEAGRYAIALQKPFIFSETFHVNGSQSMLFDIDIPEKYFQTVLL